MKTRHQKFKCQMALQKDNKRNSKPIYNPQRMNQLNTTMKFYRVKTYVSLAFFLNIITLGYAEIPGKDLQPVQHKAISEKIASEGSNNTEQKIISHPPLLKEHFEKEFLNAIPADIYNALPNEVVKAFEAIRALEGNKNDETPEGGQWLEKMFSPVASFLENLRVLVKVTVVDENGRPMNGAAVRLLQTRDFIKSDYLNDNCEPYKIKKATGESGECIFNDIESCSFYHLSGKLFTHGEMPKNNLNLEVRAPGFQTFKKDFVNVDKLSLALGCKFMETLLRHKDLMPDEGQKKLIKILTTKKKIIIPEENTKDAIEIKVVLKKETTETSKLPDSTQSKEPEKTN